MCLAIQRGNAASVSVLASPLFPEPQSTTKCTACNFLIKRDYVEVISQGV